VLVHTSSSGRGGCWLTMLVLGSSFSMLFHMFHKKNSRSTSRNSKDDDPVSVGTTCCAKDVDLRYEDVQEPSVISSIISWRDRNVEKRLLRRPPPHALLSIIVRASKDAC